MKYDRLNRRQFLVGSGGAMLAIPTLTSLLPREAQAATVAAKRFVAMAYDGGKWPGHWYPSAAQESALRAVAGVPYMREMAMSAIPGDISQVFGSAFNGAVRNQLTLLRGLDILGSPWAGHSHSSFLAGHLGTTNGVRPGNEPKLGPSVDYILAKNAKSNPRSSDLNSYVNLGLIDQGGDISYRFNPTNNSIAEVGRDFNPKAVFDRLFANTTGTTTTVPLSDRRGRVIDLVLENFNRVMNSRKLASQERHLLQEHVDIVHQIDKSLNDSTQPLPASSCAKPTAPGGDRAVLGQPLSYERVNNYNVEILAAAIKCNIVNVGTIQVNYDNDNTVYSNLGVNQSFHDPLTHFNIHTDEFLRVCRHYVSFYGKLINLLNVEEPGTNGATYLHNSLLVLGSSMGNGLSHSYLDMPMLMAGSLGGRIRAGRYIDYSDRSRLSGWANPVPLGRNYCSFLVTLLQGMGLGQADYQQSNVSEGFGSDYIHTADGFHKFLESWRLDRKNPLPGLLA